MRTFLCLIISCSLLYSCKKEEKNYVKDSLFYINHVNKLELITIDDKCGEWGGDETQLIIYRDSLRGPLLADYFEKNACENEKEQKIINSIKRIKIGEEEKKLIIESITELSEKKLNREDLPSHSGRRNQIMLSDSSMIITDFPSVELKNFKQLTERIKQK